MRTPRQQPTPWLVLATRSVLFAAAATVVWVAAQQPHPVAATMNDAPDITTYAVTHVCGTQVCVPTTR